MNFESPDAFIESYKFFCVNVCQIFTTFELPYSLDGIKPDMLCSILSSI